MLPHVVVHNEMGLDARMDELEVDMGRFYALAGTWREDCTLGRAGRDAAGGHAGVGGRGERNRAPAGRHRPGTRAEERPPTLLCSLPSTRAGVFPAWDSCATSPTGAT